MTIGSVVDRMNKAEGLGFEPSSYTWESYPKTKHFNDAKIEIIISWSNYRYSKLRHDSNMGEVISLPSQLHKITTPSCFVGLNPMRVL